MAEIQQIINILSPILSAIGGILVTLTLLLNKFRALKKSVDSTIKSEVMSNRKHQEYVRRLERQVAELNRKLDYLVDKRGK